MFNPFGKNFESVAGSDLLLLRSISEGWFIEYKSAVIEASAIGKSLSAFANHEGGWLFLGIAAQDTHAGTFAGISCKDLELTERRLREGAANHCSPSPYYEKKFILGPVPEIELAAERFIAVVRVPRSHDTPHVHKSGRIYRRIDSSSEPKAENDRMVLDTLWSRRERAQRRIEQFCSWRPDTTDREAENTYMHVTFMADPLNDRELTSKVTFERLQSLMSDNSPESGGIGFDSIYPCPGGAIARQTRTNNPFSQVFTYRYYRNANARITIPVNTFEVVPGFRAPVDSPNMQAFADVARMYGYSNFIAMDLTRLMMHLGAALQRFRVLLREDDFEIPHIYYSLGFQCIWRRMPFLDSAPYIDYLRERGMPLIEISDIVAPEEGLGELDGEPLAKDGSVIPNGMLEIFLAVLDVFGIPAHLLAGGADGILGDLVREA